MCVCFVYMCVGGWAHVYLHVHKYVGRVCVYIPVHLTHSNNTI